MKIGISTWKGKSGIVYEFTDYEPETIFKEGVTGNYIFSKKTVKEEGYSLQPVYIGEGVLKDRIAYRLNEGEVQKKGCNCISVRVLNAGESSKQIEEDLLAACSCAYASNGGCNKKEGG
jgi:hypothetical protein